MSIAEKLQTIADNEQKVYDAGYEKGKAEGVDTEEVYANGYTDGITAEKIRFWKAYQTTQSTLGYRYNYNQAFAGLGWCDSIYEPLYDFNGKHSNYPEGLVYAASMYSQSSITDTKKEFYLSETTLINNMFASATVLETIRTIHTNKTVTYSAWFNYCRSLKNITFEGEIGNSIDFTACTLLSRASIENIIGCLSDSVTGKTLTLSKTAVNNAFETSEGTADGSESTEWAALISNISNYWDITLIED